MPRRTSREVEFRVRHGRLVRHVRFPDGRSYTHHCTLDVLKEVAWLVEERREQGVTTNELWQALPDLPCTQVAVAWEFIKEVNDPEQDARRSYPRSPTLFEDTMTAFYYLAETGAAG